MEASARRRSDISEDEESVVYAPSGIKPQLAPQQVETRSVAVKGASPQAQQGKSDF
jgi:hypothetical protein